MSAPELREHRHLGGRGLCSRCLALVAGHARARDSRASDCQRGAAGGKSPERGGGAAFVDPRPREEREGERGEGRGGGRGRALRAPRATAADWGCQLAVMRDIILSQVHARTAERAQTPVDSVVHASWTAGVRTLRVRPRADTRTCVHAAAKRAVQRAARAGARGGWGRGRTGGGASRRWISSHGVAPWPVAPRIMTCHDHSWDTLHWPKALSCTVMT